MLSEMAKISMLSTLEALIQAIPKKQNNTRKRSETTTSVVKGTVASVVEAQYSSYSFA